MSEIQKARLFEKLTSFKNMSSIFAMLVSTVALFYFGKDVFSTWCMFMGAVLGVSYTANVAQKQVTTQNVQQSVRVPKVE